MALFIWLMLCMATRLRGLEVKAVQIHVRVKFSYSPFPCLGRDLSKSED